MICPNCGSGIRPGAAFCRQCGARVDNAQAGIPEEGARMSYQQPAPVYQYSSTQSSGAAITSLIVGIMTYVVAFAIACPTTVATYGIGAIICMPVLLAGWAISLITGYMGRQKIRASQGQLTGDGAAVAGIVMGWIGVGLVVLSAAIGVALLIVVMILGPLLMLLVESTAPY